jgi:competence protein ComEA
MEALKHQLARLISGAQPINKKIVFVLVGVVAVATFFLNSALSANKTSALNQPSPTESTKSTSASDALINLPQLYVHLVGEVVNPGIYLLPTGSRVIDAVVLAGGFTKKADQGSVNLARSLTDGEQVIVFRAGSSELLSSAGAAAQTLGGGSPSRAGVAGSLISLNRASQAELEQLPGVGPTLAARMIDWRLTNGGFKSKNDLQNVSGIGDKMFAAIEPLVTL